MKGHILVVDDEPAIREVVRLNLEAEGYEVAQADDAASALQVFDEQSFTLAILDVMLPDGDGFELARAVRDRSDIPIIMLSARDTDVDKAVGLGVGADDYVTKPFSPIELIARVKAHLRRYRAYVKDDSGVLGTSEVRINPVRREVDVRGEIVKLTVKEFDILQMLATHPGRVYTKAQIYERVWGEEAFGDLATVQVHIRRIRMKIEQDPDEPKLVSTVWGIGYRFEGER